MTAVLKNIGGIDFTNLNTSIMCSDPNIAILDNSGYFGYLAVDSIKENTDDPYEMTVSTSIPQGQSVEFMLLATDGSFVDTFMFNLVIGGVDYLIWNPDPTPMPGQLIDYILTSLDYSGLHTTLLPLTGLQTYKAIFVCVGISSYNYMIYASSPEASALVDYVNSGGCLYLEGGEVWYYDPTAGGYNFAPIFGINPTADGTGNVGPVAGQTGTFTQGMFFYYAGENYSIDQMNPTGGGAMLIFLDNDNGYGCGVANNAATYKTVGTSFELGSLVDLGGVSTRAVLLDSIMHFFGIFQTGVSETPESCIAKTELQIHPNPFTNLTGIRYYTTDNRHKCELKTYDITGRLVTDLSKQLSVTGNLSSVMWDGTDNTGQKLPGGVYFVRITGGPTGIDGWGITEKVLLIR